MYIKIDRNSSVSIKKQLYNGLTKLIIEGTLTYRDKLPSTRVLADELDIARNSVIEIYEQLTAEGYLFSEKGKGTFVTELGWKVDKKGHSIQEVAIDMTTENKPRGIAIEHYISLEPGTPDLEHFPSKHWTRYMKDYLYGPNSKVMGFSETKGYLPLRKALVTYLMKHKGIQCNAHQVFITSGTSGALNQIALTLQGQHRSVLSEAFVMDIVPDIFGCYGYSVKGIPVDQNGMVVDQLPQVKKPHLIYTTPSHQMPIGGVLPINRRYKLLEYAKKGGHIILEDDYDSEFRYVGAPVNALKQIDSDQVIYLGTFSKTMGPGLRVGYMVIPNYLVETFNETYSKSYAHVQVMDQYCLYRLIDEGHYEKHIYKMTKLYKKKNELLIQLVAKYFGDKVKIIGKESGLHLSLKFHSRSFDIRDRSIFQNVGLIVDYDLDYRVEDKDTKETDTLIIGYGHLSHEEIEEGLQNLALIRHQR